jgi:glycosyltransferase involved in cell wall biosynthesis
LSGLNKIVHYYPATDFEKIINPEVTFVIPALNEEKTIAEFVNWCQQGLSNANLMGQILIIDSSTDKTAEIALHQGAEVLKVPRLGLGRAYIDSIPYIRGHYVIMGDADLTYDMRDIQPFLNRFREGYEFIMGSRFKGTIAPGAMPLLHRYFGTPLTTWILNRVYRTSFSDIHCGLRGMTLDALKRMQLESQGWQYATEVVIKSVKLRLKSTEVPVAFYKDREGRQSHHKRIGWYSPWLAGLSTLRTIMSLRNIPIISQNAEKN